MQTWLLWLSCYLSCASASRLGKPVRVRGAPSFYYNTSTPIDMSTITETSSQLPSGSDNSLPRTLSSPANTSPDTPAPTGNCIDSIVTYTNEPPATVFVTVDGSYHVTVTASNASVTAPTIYETPPQACHTTIVPSLPSAAGTPRISASLVLTSVEETNSGLVPVPPLISTKPSAESFSPSPVNLRKTSTVIVTKKTPVPVVQPATPNNPPVTFNQPKTQIGPSVSQNGPTPQGPGTTSNGVNPGLINSNASPPPAISNKPSADGSSIGSNAQTPGNANSRLSVAESEIGGIASIIASVINSPFIVPSAPVSNPRPGFVAATATPTIAGVPVSIGPSSIAVGTQVFPVAATSPETIIVGSQTFIIRSDEIVGPSTTYKIQNQLAAVSTITQAPSVVTTAGVTLTIGASLAIVSGTTYRIGGGARSTIVVVNGQTIAIGSDGVVFSGNTPTTFAPAMTIAGGFEIVEVDGLTISVDQTAAIIEGTTFRIGAGATITTAVISGKTITLGPSGVVLPSTTIRPTSVPNVTAISSTHSTTSAQAASSEQADQQNSSGRVYWPRSSAFYLWLIEFSVLFFLRF